jgi:hypothetical protein
MIPLVELTEADLYFHTTIGNYHGDIYEAQLDFAINSNLNKVTVPSYYETYMKPII